MGKLSFFCFFLFYSSFFGQEKESRFFVLFSLSFMLPCSICAITNVADLNIRTTAQLLMLLT